MARGRGKGPSSSFLFSQRKEKGKSGSSEFISPLSLQEYINKDSSGTI